MITTNTNSPLIKLKDYGPLIAIRIAEDQKQKQALQKHVQIQKKLNSCKNNTLIFPYNFFTFKSQGYEISFEENLLTFGKQARIHFTDIDNIQNFNITHDNVNSEKHIIYKTLNKYYILIMIIHGLLQAANLNITNFNLSRDNVIIKDLSYYYSIPSQDNLSGYYSTSSIMLTKKLRFSYLNEKTQMLTGYSFDFILIYIPTLKDLTSAIDLSTSKNKDNELIRGLKNNIVDIIKLCELENYITLPDTSNTNSNENSLTGIDKIKMYIHENIVNNEKITVLRQRMII
jgi:hypothetical protein